MTRAAMPIYRVALDIPLPALFDYLPPNDGAAAEPGSRLVIPFGRSRRVGILAEIAAESAQDPTTLKAVERVLDDGPLLSPMDMSLIRWAADYYQQPLGEALFAALPARLRGPVARLSDAVRGVRPTARGVAIDLAELSRAPKQLELLGLLRAHPDGIAAERLTELCGDYRPALRSLSARGLTEACQLQPTPMKEPGPLMEAAQAPDLNQEQRRAVDAISAVQSGFGPFLLDGVTGSGKTEVYIRLIEMQIAAGRQTLVLVPEIALTPQLRERFRQRLPGPIAVLHSGLGPMERERGWHLAASGEATLILGTRSAVLTPAPHLGLIVVDEEHDASLKQQEGFRYSARDIAVRRAQLVGCPIVLGTATPSLETLRNADSGRYTWLRLTRRAGAARTPRVSLLDIRRQPLQAGLSNVLRGEMEAELAAGNQILLFLNRRGYAPVYTCHACGWVGCCPHCDARLTLHLSVQRLWCHHCDWSRLLPRECPDCKGMDLRMLGRGTERLEGELRALFPSASIARIDRDSTRRKGELARLFGAARRGEIQILLGTQMLAKGHDFPGVTLVGILDLDQSLYASDFRAPERTAQLIVQVAGRAGRGALPGRVVLQTRHPEHPLLQSLLTGGYPRFAHAALEERRAAELPPYSHLVLARADAPGADDPLAFLRQARHLGESLAVAGVQLLGPVPAPMERRGGRHRAQLLVQCGQRPLLQRFLPGWSAALYDIPRPRGLRWSLDVDPQDML